VACQPVPIQQLQILEFSRETDARWCTMDDGRRCRMMHTIYQLAMGSPVFLI
jgi:hypothetical protein